MQWQASQSNLVPCGNCGRKFAQDRIATHHRICNGIANKSARGSRSQTDQAPELVSKQQHVLRKYPPLITRFAGASSLSVQLVRYVAMSCGLFVMGETL